MTTKEQMRSAIIAAIKELNDRRGSTATEIKKHVNANLPDDDEQWQEATFKMALKDLDESGDILKSGARYLLSAEPEACFNVVVSSKRPREDKVADLWRNEQLCDAKVVSSEGRSFRAHRLVLATNSDYMSALLAEDRFKDSSDCPIRLPDVSSRALEHILEWMYAGSCKITSKSEVVELLQAASRLQCQDLIEQLQSATLAILDIDSCLGIWELGERLNMEKLKNEAKSFAIKSFDEVASSEDFKELPLERLLELVASDSLNVEKEEDVHTYVMKWVGAQVGGLSVENIEKLFACVRYPLMDRAFVSDRVLNEPLLMNNLHFVRKVAKSLCDSSCPKRIVGRPLAWEDVRVGINVRVIDDKEELQRLCHESAPGAKRHVGWRHTMREVAGKRFEIRGTKQELRGVCLKGERFWFPYTAFLFA